MWMWSVFGAMGTASTALLIVGYRRWARRMADARQLLLLVMCWLCPATVIAGVVATYESELSNILPMMSRTITSIFIPTTTSTTTTPATSVPNR